MRFQPKTQAEIDSEGLLKDGIYPYEIIKAEEKKSKAGADMIALTLKVYGDDGDYFVNDYLTERMMHKLYHLCLYTGLKDKYETGVVGAVDIQNKQGFCKIKVEPANDKFPAKNAVRDYVAGPGQDPDSQAIAAEEASRGKLGVQDDDIKF